MKAAAFLVMAGLAFVGCERRDGKIIIDETEVKSRTKHAADKVGEGAEKAAEGAENLGRKAADGAKDLGHEANEEAKEIDVEAKQGKDQLHDNDVNEKRVTPPATVPAAPLGIGGGPAGHDAGK